MRSLGVRAMPESSAAPAPMEAVDRGTARTRTAGGSGTRAKGEESPGRGLDFAGGSAACSRRGATGPQELRQSAGAEPSRPSRCRRPGPRAPRRPRRPAPSASAAHPRCRHDGQAATAAGSSAPWGRDGAVAEPVAPALARLDPNARYATTYRPGGAALAAFDAAVARGQIPTSYKDLVGDFGARYAPALDAPKDGALTVAVGTARAAVGPAGGPMNLLVALASSEATPSRAPLSVHIVLDISGSMSGQAIEDAKNAAEAAVDKLEATDDFSMVTFSDTAAGHRPRRPHRPASRARCSSRIHDVQADGGTNIWAGLDLGYAEARDAGRRRRSRAPRDAPLGRPRQRRRHEPRAPGRPRRARLPGRASRRARSGSAPTTTRALMSGIADRGAGGYYYVADSSQIEPALAREIDARLRPVATAVEVRVRLRPDISATHVFGSRELTAIEADAVRAQEIAVDRHEKQHGIASDRQVDAAGGMRFFIPAFARADRHATMITLQLPPGTGDRRIASVEVRYKDRVLKKNVTQELPVNLRWAASDAESALDREPRRRAGRAGLRRRRGDPPGGRARRRRRPRRGAQRPRRARRRPADRVDDARRAVLRRGRDAPRAPRGRGRAADRQMAELPLVVMLRGSGYGYL